MRFKSWSEHRAFHKRLKQEKQLESAGISRDGGNEGINCPAKSTTVSSSASLSSMMSTGGSRPTLPSNGKTSIAVLHEYVQKVLKGLISYEFSETRNAANPYCATVKLMTVGRSRGDAVGISQEDSLCTIGTGVGNSKKNAKLEAAKQALHVLIPGIEFNDDGVADVTPHDDVIQLFDLIQITDSRVHELSAKAGQPTPFVILQECLKRNSALGNTTINMKIERIKHQQHEFILNVGKHEVRVFCSNKKEGKQKAAQSMLERLHPQIKTWGSLIRLYGYGAQRRLQETRKEKDSIIRLQSQSKRQPNEPNTAILSKLRSEMKKLYDKYKRGESPTNSANVSTVIVKGIDI
ncbi:unnamed protein product [Soboliphyme baturini]|uniref:DRBM domain-containing protein n=1 Tax=Soboliphyme baturini TaxID=241478 RepID=A0A183IPG2_9BILA|nr:unnamed protein product [Soboliphyme baturini]